MLIQTDREIKEQKRKNYVLIDMAIPSDTEEHLSKGNRKQT